MTNTNELMRLLRKQAEELIKGDETEAAAIQRALLSRFAEVWCMACGHQAIRHTVAPAPLWKKLSAIAPA